MTRLARIGEVGRANGASVITTASFDLADRIKGLTHNFAATTNDVTLSPTYSYNVSPQSVGQTISNDTYTFPAPNGLNKGYVPNGLNQYSTVGGGAYTYNQNANLTSNGTYSYTYDPENRLLTANSAALSVTLTYDPLGRLQTSTPGGGATSSFLFDGDTLVEVNNSAGATTSRYVPGPGTDEPLVWYQGATLATPNWLVSDSQGSIIGDADASGNSQATYTYDPYGAPNNWFGALYRYTGQLTIPDAHLYYYKARMYSPFDGRFLQTDPVGYAADVNDYAYAGNDPINGSDPSGLDPEVEPVTVHPLPEPGTVYYDDFATIFFTNGFTPAVTVNGMTTVAGITILVHRSKVGRGAVGVQLLPNTPPQNTQPNPCQNAVQAANFLDGVSRWSGTGAAGLGLTGLAVEGGTLGAGTPVAGAIELGAGGLEVVSAGAGALSVVIRTAGTGNFTSAAVYGGTQALINASGLGGIPGAGKVGQSVASAIIDWTVGRAAPESECHH